MSDFVKAESVYVNQSMGSREEVLRFIAQRAAELGVTHDADAVYDAFVARARDDATIITRRLRPARETGAPGEKDLEAGRARRAIARGAARSPGGRRRPAWPGGPAACGR